MKTTSLPEQIIHLPEPEDIAGHYRPYASFVLTPEGRRWVDLLLTQDTFVRASAYTLTGAPAVTAVAGIVDTFSRENPSAIPPAGIDFLKQFAGAAICTLMEANGYEKTGTKKRVPHPLFRRGEVYQEKNRS